MESDTNAAFNNFWVVMAAILVFLMQLGFGMLEVGSVREKNAVNILFKNTVDICVAGMLWYFLGYGFAFGGGSSFIGSEFFALHDVPLSDYVFWFFQLTFAATAATIVSGAMAERTNLHAYIIYTLIISGWYVLRLTLISLSLSASRISLWNMFVSSLMIDL